MFTIGSSLMSNTVLIETARLASGHTDRLAFPPPQ
jgi:hypothetical protein